MKNSKTNKFVALLFGALSIAAVSCKKENSAVDQTDISRSEIQAAAAEIQAIAVSGTAAGDSIYVVNTCGARAHRDSIAFSSLPASVGTYLSANYSGYTAQRAYQINDASGTLQGYVAIINYNGNPVGVKFDAGGNFVQVLEQREGRDLRGRGWRHGGRFDDRDGLRRDTVALSNLPAAVKTYYATNYPTDTLVRAFRGKDSSLVVVSLNNGVFATVFNADNSFSRRVQMPAKSGKPNSIEQSALPANVQSYLSTTYPNYVFKHAFQIMANGTLQGYAVLIDANNIKYAVQFDASGNFVSVKTVR